jgi:hypothetical protein
VPKATAVLGLLASVLGDLYGFAAQQGGKLINDIMPNPESVEIGNISSGSREPFPFHTEDTFHPVFLTTSCFCASGTLTWSRC